MASFLRMKQPMHAPYRQPVRNSLHPAGINVLPARLNSVRFDPTSLP